MSTNSAPGGYWQCGANQAQITAGVIAALTDYFNGKLTQAQIIAVLTEYFTPTC